MTASLRCLTIAKKMLPTLGGGSCVEIKGPGFLFELVLRLLQPCEMEDVRGGAAVVALFFLEWRKTTQAPRRPSAMTSETELAGEPSETGT